MKITITGSLGNIGKQLVKELIQTGNLVTVITSSHERKKDIEVMGAIAAVGSVKNVDFIIASFTNADAVYTMVPPANYWDLSLDLFGYYNELGKNYFDAISATGVKRVVNLSTIGGHLSKGNGILQGAHEVENILNKLPDDVSITHIRPTEFYYNLLPQVHSAKTNNFIGSNIGGEVINSWVSPLDIAVAVAAICRSGASRDPQSCQSAADQAKLTKPRYCSAATVLYCSATNFAAYRRERAGNELSG